MMQHDHEHAGTGGNASERIAQKTKSQAEEAGNQARRETRGMAEEAKGAARDVMGEARATGSTLKQEARGVAGSLKDGLSAQAQAQKDNLASRIGSIAERVHQTADDLREREGWLAGLMDRGARELDNIADDIKRSDMSSLLDSAEVFARRQPALFMGASVALGFALTRVARGGGGGSRYEGYEDRSPYGGRDYRAGDESYRPTAGRGVGTGYIDDTPERPDIGQTWPQSGPGYTSTGTGTAQPGYGSSTGGGTAGGGATVVGGAAVVGTTPTNDEGKSDDVVRGSNV